MDLIERQAAIDALDVLCQEHRYKIPGKQETYSQYNEAWQDALDRAEGAIFNLPSVQSEPCEDAEFWQKRAEYYSKICLDLIAGMNQGVKIDSIEINEEGINFKMTQPEPCEDAVSRNAIFKNLTRWIDTTQANSEELRLCDTDKKFPKEEIVESLPSVQTERTPGRWIPQDNNKVNGMTSTAVYYEPKCSVCGHCANYTNFCPNCGADMRGERDETD